MDFDKGAHGKGNRSSRGSDNCYVSVRHEANGTIYQVPGVKSVIPDLVPGWVRDCLVAERGVSGVPQLIRESESSMRPKACVHGLRSRLARALHEKVQEFPARCCNWSAKPMKPCNRQYASSTCPRCNPCSTQEVEPLLLCRLTWSPK